MAKSSRPGHSKDQRHNQPQAAMACSSHAGGIVPQDCKSPARAGRRADHAIPSADDGGGQTCRQHEATEAGSHTFAE